MKAFFALLLSATFFAPIAKSAEEAKVTVIAILANDHDKTIDPKLKDIAAAIQRDEPKLTGFRIERTTSKTLAINQKELFPLVDDVTAEVTVLVREDKEKKVRLTVKVPHTGEVEYTTVREKYFPIVTRYQNKNKDTLVLAISVKPLPPKPVEKDKEKPVDK